jgi:hypothetical protein
MTKNEENVKNSGIYHHQNIILSKETSSLTFGENMSQFGTKLVESRYRPVN